LVGDQQIHGVEFELIGQVTIFGIYPARILIQWNLDLRKLDLRKIVGTTVV
jgi:hypothetical protein